MPFDSWPATDFPTGVLFNPNGEQVDPVLTTRAYGPEVYADPSNGLRDNVWSCQVIGSDVYIHNITTGSVPVKEFSRANIIHISLAFDQLARPVICATVGNSILLWWYDPVVPAHVLTTVSAGSKGFVYLDDSRDYYLSGQSDIMLIYQKGETAYYRLQRDRFLVEYTTDLVAITGLNLTSIGMNQVNRLQINYTYTA